MSGLIKDKRPVMIRGVMDSSWPDQPWEVSVADVLQVPKENVFYLGYGCGYAMLGYEFNLPVRITSSPDKLIRFKQEFDGTPLAGYDFMSNKVPTSLIAYIDVTPLF